MRYRNKYNNQPREEKDDGTDKRWGGDGGGGGWGLGAKQNSNRP